MGKVWVPHPKRSHTPPAARLQKSKKSFSLYKIWDVTFLYLYTLSCGNVLLCEAFLGRFRRGCQRFPVAREGVWVPHFAKFASKTPLDLR